MQGCRSSGLHSPGWDAEPSFQGCKCSQSTRSASLAEQRSCRAAPWAAPANTNSSSQLQGSTQSSILGAHTSTENRTALEKMPWTVVIGAWPAKLADQQLSYVGPVTLLTFLMCILMHMNSPLSFLLSPHSYSCFFPALCPVLLNPYQISQGYLGSLDLTELLIQFPRRCWPCDPVLTQETLILPLQSSVMFGHCSCSPTISTCEFQQSSGHAL